METDTDKFRLEHAMTKSHYISFVAAVSPDNIQMVKLYPEGKAEARFKINGVRKIVFYCNKDGLFQIDMMKHRGRFSCVLRTTDNKQGAEE